MSHLQFVPRPQDSNRKTQVFDIMTNQRINLGIVGFFPRWRKFVFEGQPKAVFDDTCMQEIIDFLKSETEKWKASL